MRICFINTVIDDFKRKTETDTRDFVLSLKKKVEKYSNQESGKLTIYNIYLQLHIQSKFW